MNLLGKEETMDDSQMEKIMRNCTVTFGEGIITVRDTNSGQEIDVSVMDPVGTNIYGSVGNIIRHSFVHWSEVKPGTRIAVMDNNGEWHEAYFAAYLPMGIRKYGVFAEDAIFNDIENNSLCCPEDASDVVYAATARLLAPNEDVDA